MKLYAVIHRDGIATVKGIGKRPAPWDEAHAVFIGSKAKCLKFTTRYKALAVPVWVRCNLAYRTVRLHGETTWALVRSSDGCTPTKEELGQLRADWEHITA